MAIDVWPNALLPAGSVRWSLQSVARPGEAGDGTTWMNRVDGGGRWTCEVSKIWLRTPQMIKLARALEGIVDGGANPIIVPACEKRFAPFPAGPLPVTGFSDGSYFSDGSGFASDGIEIYLDGDADLRATSIALDIVTAAELIGGERFSIAHPDEGWRLYNIKRVTGDIVSINPPLRDDVADGTRLHFDRPACVMRMINANEFFEAIALGRFSNLTAQFEEYFGDVAGDIA